MKNLQGSTTSLDFCTQD